MRTFFFYDLETSGFSARYDRIMQFAGQRTNDELELIGQPVNLLVKLTDDILPSPGAVLTTHITPQMTVADGISEADFCRYFLEQVATPDTTILGYNSTRFDDEFIRHTLWRNFHDPYQWAWAEGRDRWDLLDVTRLVRALRPDGINWPTKRVAETDQLITTVNLVDMAKCNGFENDNAHDALADVKALISLARLLRQSQPTMWRYLLDHHDKHSVLNIITPGQPKPFVYASGRYSSSYQKTTVATVIAEGRTPNSYLVWDLRYDPVDFTSLSEAEILSNLTADRATRRQDDFVPIPIKELSINKCPAVAPLGVLDAASETRISLSQTEAMKHYHQLNSQAGLIKRLTRAWCKRPVFPPASDVEGKLYDGFTPKSDQTKIRLVAAADSTGLADLHPNFTDERLDELLFRYKARQYPTSLSESEEERWRKFRRAKLERELPAYLSELSKLANGPAADQFILEELQLWAESIAPVDY
ncbi:exodeoxyribonuclease I [TM7 phylum sp. oral taxon 356]|nr:exodeoxyribonuclease I [TM7 phylum sp. oral taxon 356]